MKAAPTPVHQRLTEAQLQTLCFQLCRVMNLWAYHTFDSCRSVKGFPDLVIVGRGVLFRELKDWKPSSKPSVEQVKVLALLTAAGQSAEVWTPADWFSGRIRAELSALRH